MNRVDVYLFRPESHTSLLPHTLNQRRLWRLKFGELPSRVVPCVLRTLQEVRMLNNAVIFLVIALIAGLLGFVAVAGIAATIAKVCFIIFLVLFVVSLITGRGRTAV